MMPISENDTRIAPCRYPRAASDNIVTKTRIQMVMPINKNHLAKKAR